MKITKLTPEQEAQIPGWVKKWVDIGLSTEPADFEAATEAALKAYALCNLKKPMVVLRMGSPYAATVGGALAWQMLRSLRPDQVGAQVGDQVWAQVGDQVWAQVRDQVGAAFYGQHDAGFLGWSAYFSRVCKLPGAEKIEPLARIAANCGWVWFFSGAAIITDRPRALRRDEQNRLHCENGPAIEYRDGFSIYAWHGTRMPKEWVEGRETIDPAEILKAENVEQRAAGAAMLGWSRMVSKLKRKIIDGDPESDLGALIELTLPGLREPGRFLQAQCPRNGTIVEGVPRVSDIDDLPIETVIAAQAWRVGDPQSEYSHPPVRT